MKKSLFEVLFSLNSRRAATKAPKSSTLRLEALESRELLDAAAPTSLIACPPLDPAESSLFTEDAPVDLASVELLAANSATTWIVSSTDDNVSVEGTLRNAIANAQDGDTITFDASLQGATITLGGTQLEIAKSITIDAMNLWNEATQTPGITIDANQLSGVFFVNGAENAGLHGLSIVNGKTPGSMGGGVFAYQVGSITASNCVISGNEGDYAGGIALYESDGVFTDCAIDGNVALRYGGGVVVRGGTGLFTNCSISENASTSGNGGGISIQSFGYGTFVNCVISKNSASSSGGGIDVVEPDRTGEAIGTFINCAITENAAYSYSAAYIESPISAAGVFKNCTISGNTSQLNYLMYFEGKGYFYNSILARNNGEVVGSASYGNVECYNSLSAFSDWRNFDASGGDNYLYDSNFPLFSDAENGDYTLAPRSQAINKGNNDYVSTDYDLDGLSRIADGKVDLGAFEYQGETTVVERDLVVTTTLDVVDWDDGETSLREAIYSSEDGDTITFADSLQGGVVTLDGTQLNISKTITIDASNLWDEATQSPGITIDGNQESRVFCVIASGVEFNGLAISNGNTSESGGGVYGGAAFTNCAISGNSAFYGGGVFIPAFGVASFTNCSINANNSLYYGGGAYIGSGGRASFSNCSIDGNSSSYYGGGVYVYGGGTFANCEIIDNTSENGGGAYVVGYSEFTDCTISGNAAENGGGAYVYFAGTANFANSAIVENTASNDGGGAYFYRDGKGSFSNCSINGNSASSGGGAYLGGSGSFTDSLICDNFSSTTGGGVCIADGGAWTFTNGAIDENTSCYGGGLYISGSGAGYFSSSSITGNTGSYYGGAAYLYGFGQFTDCAIKENTTPWDGGGAYVSNTGNAEYINCEISDNAANRYGGGVYVRDGGNGGFANCIIGGNASNGAGGAAYILGTCAVTNSLICDNISTTSGGGAHIAADGVGTFTNCTIVNNAANSGGGANVIGAGAFYNSIVVLNNGGDISGTVSGYNTLSTFTNWTNQWDAGVVNYEFDPNLPLFSDVADGDYTPAPNSQAVNKGDNAYVTVNCDLAGEERVLCGAVDLGAYEYQGNVFTVTTSADVVDPNDGMLSLREALADVGMGDTITFDSSLQGATITLGGTELEITKSLTIDATNLLDATTQTPGLTIDANRQSRIFNVEGASAVEFIGLTLTNGETSTNGGAVNIIGSSASFTSCVFTNNHADGRGGAVFIDRAGTEGALFFESIDCDYAANESLDNGGAIYVDSMPATIQGGDFSGNASGTEGGGVRGNFSDISIANATFTGNIAGNHGGAVRMEQGSATISDSTFVDNSCGEFGGAVQGYRAPMTISGSTFSGNSGANGGAIQFFASESFELTSSFFSNNASTDGNGGALYLDVVAAGSSVLTEVEFEDNEASGFGGAIFTAIGPETFDACVFTNNSAVEGGAVYTSWGSIEISNSTFTQNESQGHGGAARFNETPFTISNTSFSGNVSGNEGGAIKADGGAASVVVSCDFSGNSATSDGGAIQIWEAASLEIEDVEFIENVSGGAGGAVFACWGSVEISNSTFTRNESEGYGGAVFAQSDDSAFTTIDSDYEGNSSLMGAGGAIHVESMTTTIQGGEFKNNSTASWGGAVRQLYGSATIDGVVFTSNTSGNEGGALQTHESAIEIVNSAFTENEGQCGGALRLYRTPFTISNSTFSKNVSEGDGGAMKNDECSDGVVTSCVFSENSAAYDGGAVFACWGSVEISNSTFTRNESQGYGGAVFARCADSAELFTSIDCDYEGNSSLTGAGGAIHVESMTTTIQGGEFKNNSTASWGGAVRQVYGSATIDGVVFTSNTSGNEGGALQTHESALELANSAFTENEAQRGGALRLYRTPFTISNSTFSKNVSGLEGGAMKNDDCPGGVMTSCVFYENSAAYDGGAIQVWSLPSLEMENVEFVDNASSNHGGAIYIGGSSNVSVSRGSFTNNSASGCGGAIYVGDGANFSVSLGSFTNNSAIGCGGAIENEGGVLDVVNSLVANNTADYGGGVDVNSTESTTSLTNVTIAGNRATTRGGGIDNKAEFVIKNSIVAENYVDETPYDVGGALAPRAYNTLSRGVTWTSPSESNYEYDPELPLFADAANNDYALTPGSQAYNKGDNSFVTASTDLADAPRIVYGIVDLGAYELQNSGEVETPSTCVTTSSDVVDPRDGFVSLREAISIYSVDGDTITFADFLRGATITLAGTQLEITKSITIDAMNLWDEATQTPGITVDANRRSRVFYATASAVEFNGLAIVNGEDHKGGGVYVYRNGAFTNCTINGNSASNSGGGAYVYSGVATFANCSISGNTTSGSGGGAYIESGVATFTNCSISGNSAFGSGELSGAGGVYIAYYGEGTFANCEISGNSAANGGGVLITSSSGGTFANCAISGNTASNAGGGLYILYGEGAFTNCAISGNTAPQGGGAHIVSSGEGTFANSIVALNYGGNIVGTYATENSLIGENPLFVRAPVFEDGTLVNADEIDLHLASYSPFIDYLDEGYIGAYEFVGERTDRPQYSLVTTLDDEFDLTNDAISLREAIYMSTSAETITFADGLSGTIALGCELFIDSVKIDGDNRITLDGQGSHRVLYAIGNVEMSNVSVINGESNGDGGGVYIYSGSATFTNCSISGNSGGGAYVNTGSATFINCSIIGNSGVGAYLYSGEGTFANCSISGNSGGGARLYSAEGTFANCEISGNSYGGAYIESGEGTFTNCTISGNSSGGARVNGEGTGAFTNSIVALNYGGDIVGAGTYTTENSLIGENPLFVCAPIFENGTLVNADDVDLHLASYSPFIDYLEEGYLGAYEFTGERTPRSQYNLVTTLDDEFDLTNDAISLREAIYMSTSAETITFAADLSGTIALGCELFVDSIKIDGDNRITLDGQGGSRVLYANGNVEISNVAVINGRNNGDGGGVYVYSGAATFTNCAISGNSAFRYGGGVYVSSGAATFTNCTISGNFVSGHDGGGVYISSGVATFTNCAISGNNAFYDGGGVYVYAGAATFSNCAIRGNSDNTGGVVISHYGTGTFTNCTISGNSAGGAYVAGVGTFTSCAISGNSTSNYGGGVRISSGVGLFTNCAISENSASTGGGVYISYSGTGTFTNCTISGNTASVGGGVHIPSGTGTFYNSIVALNSLEDIYGNAAGYNTLSSYVNWSNASDPDVVNYEYDPSSPLFFAAARGDYRLALGSQAIEKGNNEYLPEGLEIDMDGASRIRGENVDLGVFESFLSLRFSQYHYFQGEVELSGKIHNLAKPATLAWISGGERTLIGSYNNEGSFLWDTTILSDGSGAFFVEYETLNGEKESVEIQGVVLNDANVKIWRGEISENATLDADLVHVVVGTTTILSGVSVTIEENAVVKFVGQGNFNVSEDATLAIGDGVVLTRIEDDSVGGDTNLDGANTTPKSGAAYFGGAGTFEIAESAELRHTTLQLSGTLAGNQTLLSGRVYRVADNLTVPGGVTLTILPGAILKFDSGKSLVVKSSGTLIANGTASKPIVFTSVYDSEYGGQTLDDNQIRKPNPGDWDQIRINGGSAVFNHAIIRYAGSDRNNSDDCALFVSSGCAEFNNGSILYSLKAAAHGNGDALRVTNSIISEAVYAVHCGTYVNCVIDSVDFLCNTDKFYGNPTSFVNCVISRVAVRFYTAGGPSYAYKNNLFYNPVGVGVQTFSAVGSDGNIWGDPKFRDAEAGDYRLTVGSPCIDAGDGEAAPEFDKVGAPRVDDPYVVNTGTPTPSGAYCDIGAFEFVDDAVSNLDLTPIDIQASASAEIGGELTVQWTIRNDGSVEIDGKWADAFYLVTDRGERVYIREVEHVGSILSGDTQTFYATLKTPNALPGEYRVEVDVNSNRAVFEGANGMNNSFVSTRKVAITTPELELPLADVALGVGEEKLYRLVVPAGESYYLTVNSDAVVIRVREDYVPAATLFDAESETFNNKSFVKFDAAEETRVFYIAFSSRADVVATITQEDDATAPAVASDPYDLSQLTLDLDVPDARAGRVARGAIIVTNNGEASVWAPMFIVMTEDNCDLAWSREELELSPSDNLTAFAFSEKGNVALVKPGEIVEIPFYFRYSDDEVNVSVQFYRAKPTSIYSRDADSPWQIYADYCEAMREAARIFAQRGKIERDADKLQILAQALVDGEDCVGIAGSVIRDGSGSPVAERALVATWTTLDDAGEEISHSFYAATDANGYFSFDFLPATVVTIRDEVADVERVFDLSDGTDRVGVRLIEAPLVSLTGRVKTPEGELLEGVVVRARLDDERVFFAETDAFGVYTFAELPLGEWTVSLVGSGVYPQVESQTVALDQPTTAVNFAVAQGYQVKGFIVDSDGIGVADLTLILSGNGVTQGAAITEGNGSFAFENVPSGTYTLGVYDALDRLLRIARINVESDLSTTISLADAAASLSGRIVGSNGIPLPDLLVLLSRDDVNAVAKVGADGVYRFDNLDEGVYKLQIVGLEEEYEVDLGALDGASNSDIVLPYKAVLSGRLVDATGAPISEGTLYLERDGRVSSFSIDQEGNFLVLLPEVGVYAFWGGSSGGVAIRETIEIVAGVNTWTPRLGTGKARVTLYGIDATIGENVKWWLQTVVDGGTREATGGSRESLDAFDISGLPDGEYRLNASCGAYDASTTFVVANGSTVDVRLDFVESTTIALSTTLTAPEGVLCDFSEAVAFVYNSQSKIVSISHFFDENGVGQLSFDGAGTYSVVVFCGRCVARSSIAVGATATEAQIQLQEATSTISGKVTLAGEVVESACVYITDANDVIVGYGYTDENGEYCVACLETGELELRVVASGAEDLVTTIAVQEGENVVEEIVLESNGEVATLEILDINDYADLNDVVDDGDVITMSNYWIILPSTPKSDDLRRELSQIENDLSSIHDPDPCCGCNEEKVRDYDSVLADTLEEYEQLKESLDRIIKNEKDQKWQTTTVFLSGLSAILTKLNPTFAIVKWAKCAVSFGSFVCAARDIWNVIRAAGNLSAENLVSDVKSLFTPFKKTLVRLASNLYKWAKNNILHSEKTVAMLKDFANTLGDFSSGVTKALGNFSSGIYKSLEKIALAHGVNEKTAVEINRLINRAKECASNLLSSVRSLPFFDILVLGIDIKVLVDLVDEHTDMFTQAQQNLETIGGKISELKGKAKNADCTCGDCQCDRKVCKCKTGGSCTCDDVCNCKFRRKKNPGARDPNEINGPVGADFVTHDAGTEDEPYLVIDGANWVDASEQQFRIYFENKPTAEAAAQEVFVSMTLPEEFDATALQISDINIGNEVYTLTSEYELGANVWLFKQTSTGDYIKVAFDYNRQTCQAKWYLRSYVLSTYDNFPANVYAGFLPPNNKEVGDGEGYVSFSVKPKEGLATGTRIETYATIIFDTEDPIDTNVWVNTLDVDAPTLTSVAAAFNEETREFAINWSGEDVGSGVDSFEVFVSVDGGETFAKWLMKTTETSGVYVVPSDASGDYVFKAIVYDGAGNAVEGATESIRVDSGEARLSAPVVTSASTASTITLSWNAVERASGYEIDFNGTTYEVDASETSYIFTGLANSTSYEFVARAVGDGTFYANSEDVSLTVETTAPVRLATPTFAAEGTNFDTITITWEAVPNASAYSIYYAVAADEPVYTRVSIGASKTSYALRGLEPSTNYYVAMRADGDGLEFVNSYRSSAVAASTSGEVPTLDAPTVTANATDSTIALSWNVVPGALRYEIEFNGSTYSFGPSKTSYAFTNLVYSTLYSVVARAVGDGVTCITSEDAAQIVETSPVSATGLTRLARPVLTATASDFKTISVEWEAIPNAASYTISYAVKSTSLFYKTATIAADQTSYTVRGLQLGTTYYLKIRANGDGVSYTHSPQGSTITAKTKKVEQLARPTIRVVGATSESLDLAWNAVPHASSYTVSYAVKASNPVYTQVEVDAETTSYSVWGLQANTSYYVKLRANGDNVEYKSSSQSPTVTAKTERGAAELDAPTITGTTATASTISVAWTAVSGAAGYLVECGDQTATVAASETTYLFTGLAVNASYSIRVKALGDGTTALDSAYSEVAKQSTTALVQLARPILTTTSTTNSAIAVAWDAIPNANGYTLSYAVKASSPVYIEIQLDASATSYTISGLTSNTSYYVKLRADGDNVEYKNSAQSPTITAKTTNAVVVLDAPTITGTTATASTITVNWSAVAGATGYALVCGDRSATVEAGETSFVFTGLSKSATYSIQVKALGNGTTTLDSSYSEVATRSTTALVQLARPALTATATTDSSITVEWGAIPDASSYTLSYAVKASNPVYQTASYGASKTSAVIRNLEPGTSYYLKIRANGDNVEYSNSAQSPTITAKTAAANAPATTPSGACPHCAAALDSVKACLAKLDELMYAIADYAVELGDAVFVEEDSAERLAVFEDDALLDETDDGLFDEFVEESFGELDLRVRFAYEAEEI